MAQIATKTVHPSITLDRILAAVQADQYLGFCVNCGTDVSNVEPDARGYKCEACGDMAVYGAEELLFI
jgi:DNA-directed RNA polymerase subunit RPC12/RpoP